MTSLTIPLDDIFWALAEKKIPWRDTLAVTSITSKMPDGSDRERLVAALRGDEFAPLVNARLIFLIKGVSAQATDAWLRSIRRHGGNYIGIPVVEAASNPLLVTFSW